MNDDISAKRKSEDRNKNFSAIGDIIGKYEISDEDKYISREFQKYGYDLARELGDLKNRSLYIKLAKEYPRAHLENARSFVKDAKNVRSLPKLFMWRLNQISKKSANKND